MEFQLPAGFEVTQAPSKAPVLFSGDKAVVYGILKGPSELMSPVDCTASLKGQILDQPLEYSIPFEVPGNSPSFPIPIIHHLAAKALIKDWERDGGNKKSEIVKLSIESSVVSSHTAFVAIDESNQPVRGAMKTWDITAKEVEPDISALISAQTSYALMSAPTNYACRSAPTSSACMSAPPKTKKGGGILSSLFSSGSSSSQKEKKKKTAAPPKQRATYKDLEYSAMECNSAISDCYSAAPVCHSAMRSYASEEKCESMSASGPGHTRPTGDSLSSLISLQQADGSWKLDDVIAKVLSKSLKELSDACPVKCDGGVATLWATILCVVYLELKHPSQKDEWELIAMKAELWLDGQSLPAGADLNAMKAAAKKLIA